MKRKSITTKILLGTLTASSFTMGFAATVNALPLANKTNICIQSDEIRVSGEVTDENGNPMVGVAVVLKGKTHKGTQTDLQGRFSIEIPAESVLIFKHLGYKTREILVQGQKNISVTMTPDTQELSEVTITSTGAKREVKNFAGTVNIVSSSQIKELALPTVGDAIRLIPGANYTDEDGRGLRPGIGLRGLEPNRNSSTLVVIDGKIPIGQSYSDMGGYYMMPIGAVESVEVIKGASPALYGSGSIGGVVNIITKKGSLTPYTNLSLRYGNHNQLNLGIETAGTNANGNFNYYAGLHRRQGDGFRNSRSKFYTNDLTLNLGGKLSEKDELNFFFNAFEEDSQTPGGLSQAQWDTDPTQSVNPHDFMQIMRFSGSVSYKRHFDETNNLTTALYGGYFKRDWWFDNRNADTSKRAFQGVLRDVPVIGLFSDYERTNSLFGKKNKLLTGIRLHGDMTMNNTVQNKDITQFGQKTGSSSSNVTNSISVIEAYIFDELHLTDKFYINPALRYTHGSYAQKNYVNGNWTDNKKENAFIYSLGLFYKFSDKYRIYAVYSKGYQMPRYRDALETKGDLDAEKSNNYEIGIRLQPAHWFEMEVTAYLLDFNNKIFREGGLLNNGGKTLHRGIELNGSLYPIKGLKLYASGAIQRATIEEGQHKGNRVPYAPRYVTTAGIKYHLPLGNGTLIANAYANFVSTQFSDAKNTEIASANGNVGVIPRYQLFNATLNYQLNNWNFSLNGLNLFNHKYFTFRHASWGGIMPAATRSLSAGIGYKF
ncbi:TonB-dependent receptor [Capnocytophaga sp.]|uniref:TonB-dependent receptor n=1 Tax=Capnocytophaga sp. TaxID=44737 RepID=UPI0026DB9891|nr:TonB-dependent receptor [Capnocytophaga sp.]MDO5106515.1 TonB-dependent receptor [Capnocytophaga sp.]